MGTKEPNTATITEMTAENEYESKSCFKQGVSYKYPKSKSSDLFLNIPAAVRRFRKQYFHSVSYNGNYLHFINRRVVLVLYLFT